MLNLLKAIPSKDEYVAMDDEQKDFLCMGLFTLSQSHDVPKEGTKYLPPEIMAYMACKYPVVLDLVVEFDLGVEWNE
jgi:hypothetical protein